MQKRSPAAVLLLPFVTLGIYSVYWEVKTKGEMNRLGADIPTAWLIIIPIANIWWMWKYCQGVEKVTGSKLNALLVFVGFMLIGFIMSAIVQDSFNNVGAGVSMASAAPVPAAAPAPMPVAAPSPTPAPADTETPPTAPTPPTV